MSSRGCSPAEGFDPPEELLRRITACLEGEYPSAQIKMLAPAALAEVLEERRADQRSWPAVTDCDRLDAAFEELNSLGIMARHHWYCCSNCGGSAMFTEYERLGGEWEVTPIVGYTFYHLQNTAYAVKGGGIYLGYGPCDPDLEDDESASLSIAGTVCDVLTQHGLITEWNGELSTRILVQLDWKRRASPPRFTEAWASH